MPDYKEMYLHLFRASEEAINRLIAAQRACENRYVEASEPEGRVTVLGPGGRTVRYPEAASRKNPDTAKKQGV